MNRHHDIQIGPLSRSLPIVAVSDEISIAFLKLYGDPELVEAIIDAMTPQVSGEVELLAGPEAGAVLLTHLLAEQLGLPYVIARKKRKPYMVSPLSVALDSITTTGEQRLFIDDEDALLMAGKNIAIIDEVVSTGGTLTAMRDLIAQAGGTTAQVCAVAVEGDERRDVTSLIHLPIFPNFSS